MKFLNKIVDSHVFRDVFEEYFKEHSSCSSGRVGGESDGLEDSPVQGFSVEEMTEQMS
jgi:hypothetical protein